jgi:hypothetical protein
MLATTPYFYRRFVIPVAPLARLDWHSEPEQNIDLDLPGWKYLGTGNEVSPGSTVASYGTLESGSGHVGFLDYDGSWIAAGSKKINKFIHLSDSPTTYQPAHFRTR